MFFRRGYFLLWIFITGGCPLWAGIFPFQLSWDDQSQTATDLSWLNHKPAGLFGPIHIGSDGHLYAGSQQLRFLGINFTAGWQT